MTFLKIYIKVKIETNDECRKHFLYTKLKSSFEINFYSLFNDFFIRNVVTKHCISDHRLEIENGPREQRL